MSQENLELMRAFYDTWSRGDYEGWEEFFDPDVEWHTAREDPDADVYRGRPALWRMFERWLESFGPLTAVAEEFIDMGDRVFVWQKTFGRGSASGVDVFWEGAYVWTLRNRKIVKVQIFFSRNEALQAAGITE
jgi:ketosteroid isomerase-like protein